MELYNRARAFDFQPWGHEFESRIVHSNPEGQTIVRKGDWGCKTGVKTVLESTGIVES